MTLPEPPGYEPREEPGHDRTETFISGRPPLAGYVLAFVAGTIATSLAVAVFMSPPSPVLQKSIAQQMVDRAPCAIEFRQALLQSAELGQIDQAVDAARKAGVQYVTTAHTPAKDGSGEYVAVVGFICPPAE